MKLKKKLRAFFTLNRKANDGFTLVELIVVIAVLAILGGVAVPAYSGYVKKAERANDEALLNEINTAFVSACMMNGANNFGLTNVDATLTNGEFTYNAPYADSFNNFYEGGEFKVFEAIIYNAKTGAFAEATASSLNIYNILKTTYGDEIATLIASNLGAFGAETLLTETGSVIEWAEGFNLHENAGDAYWAAVLSYVGLTASDFEGGFASIPAASRYNAVALALIGKGVDEEIAGAMLSNSTALYAAQNTSSVTTDALGNWLGTGKTAADIQSSSSGATLAEAGAIYGLYMAYKGENFDNKNGNVLEVMGAAMSDSAFATWVSGDEGKAELEAYKASMEIVYGATSDSEAKNAILTNGFDDPELIKVLESLMGN